MIVKRKVAILVVAIAIYITNIATAATPVGYWPLDVRDVPAADQTPDSAPA